MQITLSQRDVETAITMFLEARGLTDPIEEMEFTQTRKPKNVTCDITFFDEEVYAKPEKVKKEKVKPKVKPEPEPVAIVETEVEPEVSEEEQPSGNLFQVP